MDREEGLICQSVGAGPIAAGWWMADGGSAGVQRKQLVPCWSLLFSSALHPSLIPPVLFLWFSRAFSQSITVSLSSVPSAGPGYCLALSRSLLHLIAISINMHLWGKRHKWIKMEKGSRRMRVRREDNEVLRSHYANIINVCCCRSEGVATGDE